MRRLLLICAVALFGLGGANAQLLPGDYKLFNHLSAGVSVGLDGIGIDVATPVTRFLAIRAGYAFMPGIKYSTTIDLDGANTNIFIPNEAREYKADLKGKLKMGNFKLLVDFYPFKLSSFHLTVGAYIGKGAVVSAYTPDQIVKDTYCGNSGIELGNTNGSIFEHYTLVSDEEGKANIDLKVNGFKPYVGIGFGRAVPKKRVNVTFDLGVQFWGTPALWTNVKYLDYYKEDYVAGYDKVDKNRITNSKYKDVKDAIKVGEKIRVYPVLKLTVNGRIF